MNTTRATPKKIGILGTGQLGQMLQAAGQAYAEIELFPHRSAQIPTDLDLLLIENEFLALENLPADKLFPPARSIERARNKLSQKRLFQQHDLPSARHQEIRAGAEIPASGVLKTALGGYDGLGTLVLDSDRLTLGKARSFVRRGLQSGGVYWEEKVSFQKELALVFCQTENELFHYPLVETIQTHGTCEWVKSLPKNQELTEKAYRMGQKVAEIFHLQGVFAIEFFWTKDGQLLINEIAPRVHNSGHFTLDACPVSQFEAHIRAALELPLQAQDFEAQAPFVMMNFLGTHPPIATSSSPRIYNYGKAEARPGRKMGHANWVDSSAGSSDELLERMKRIYRA